MHPPEFEHALDRARYLLEQTETLLITAGAGMGVDSGLPDFRGPEGFWRAYPALRGLRFEEMSTPSWFARDPSRAWGFFGHRLNLYRSATPHAGFEVLHRWTEERFKQSFVVTSNVDGQFQKANFDSNRIWEIHGTIHFLQCSDQCSDAIWSADVCEPIVDESDVRCNSELPRCPDCNAIARPNILMFNDWSWISRRTDEQSSRFRDWLSDIDHKRLAVIEIGAGKAISSIRTISESVESPIIRINPRDSDGPARTISLAAGAADTILRLDAMLRS